MENNDTNKENISDLQKAFREAVQEATAEVTQMQQAAHSLRDALEVLQEESGGEFRFREMPTHSGDLVLETNLLTTTDYSAHALRVRINRQGEMFTNLPDDASKAPPLPEEESQEDAPQEDIDQDWLSRQMAEISSEEEARKEAMEEEGFASRLSKMDKPPEVIDSATIANPTEEAVVLREIGEKAALDGYIFSAALAAATPAQEALAEGIRQAEKEMEIAKTAARGLIEGFAFLHELTQGAIHFEYSRADGASDLILEVSPTVSRDYQFQTYCYKVNALGEINIGHDPEIFSAAVYDAATDTDKLLKLRAEAAVAAGLASSALYDGRALTPAQQTVLDGIRRTEEEIAMARVAADTLVHELEDLKRQTNGLIDFKQGTFGGGRQVVITINPDDRYARHILVDGNGMMHIGNDPVGCFVFDEAAVGAALKPLVKEALFRKQAAPANKKQTTTPRPAP